MALFGKKKMEAPSAPGPMSEGIQGSPVDIIRGMKQQGMNNNQIIQSMQQQGYNPQQIFDAINMVEPGNIPAGPVDSNYGMPRPMGQPEMAQQTPNYDSSSDTSREKIEEMAEAIIDEKWEELVKSINKIIEWKNKVEGSINGIEQEIKDLKDNFGQLQSSIIGKINEYDKNIINVGTEVKAMSQVFEKVLPTFTENIGELRRIVKGAKK